MVKLAPLTLAQQFYDSETASMTELDHLGATDSRHNEYYKRRPTTRVIISV